MSPGVSAGGWKEGRSRSTVMPDPRILKCPPYQTVLAPTVGFWVLRNYCTQRLVISRFRALMADNDDSTWLIMRLDMFLDDEK